MTDNATPTQAAQNLPQKAAGQKPPVVSRDVARIFSNIEVQLQVHQAAVQMSNILAKCDILPEHFRNKPSNCYIASRMAIVSGMDPIMVCQCMGVIDNKPVWYAKWYGALLDNSPKWFDKEYDYTTLGETEVESVIYVKDRSTGQSSPKKILEKITDIQCVYSMVERETGKRKYGPPVSLTMAVKEGWYGKRGSKWKSLTETMLGNRALTFWVKQYESGLEFGMYSQEEAEDMRPIEVESEVVDSETFLPVCQACGKPSDPALTTVLDGFTIYVCSQHCLGVRQAAYAEYQAKKQKAAEEQMKDAPVDHENESQEVAGQVDGVDGQTAADDPTASDVYTQPSDDSGADQDQSQDQEYTAPPPPPEPAPKPASKNGQKPNPDAMSENEISDWYDAQQPPLRENFDIEYSKGVAEGKDNHTSLRNAMKAVL